MTRSINIIDVTLRDAHQSLWSTRMTNAMMAPWLDRIDDAGFHTVDLVGGAVFDVCVRYLRENPWERMRLAADHIRRTPINVWLRGQSLFTFELFADDVVDATVRHIAACGVRHITTYDALNDTRNVEVSVSAAKASGIGVTGAVVYTFSPAHTDEYYQDRVKELAALGVDRICLKDPSGLLVPERAKTLVAAIKAVAGALPLEIHSHCLSGLAPEVYFEAMDLGVDFFHTAISPLAHGASLPATETLVKRGLDKGYAVATDQETLREMAQYFTWVARREGKPLGQPVEHDPSIYAHQVPGGMISNLRTQLKAARIEHRLDEVLEEVARVREDLGYPIMVSPFAQFLITQATLNVVQGERYKTIPDEIRKYALGYYGRPAAPMAQAFLDRAVSNGKLPFTGRPGKNILPAIPRLQRERGPFRTQDELLLAACYEQGLVERLKEGPEDARPLRFRTTPVIELVEYLTRKPELHSVRLGIKGVSINMSSQ